MSWKDLVHSDVFARIIGTIGLLLCVVLFDQIFVRAIQARKRLPKRVRRRWIVNARNLAFFGFLIGAVVIWSEQLRMVAAGVMVVAVAFVIATREIWLNVMGFLFRSGAHFFSIGDRIEIGDFRGDVIDQRVSGATILEIGPGTKSHQYTGRAVFIPNSKFLSQPVVNETFMKSYVFHIVTVPLKGDADWEEAETALLQAANELCAPYQEKARAYMKNLERRHSLDAPGVEPRIHVQLPEPGRINLMLRMPIPARRRGRVEQELMRRYLQNYKEIQKQKEAAAAAETESRGPEKEEVRPEEPSPSAEREGV